VGALSCLPRMRALLLRRPKNVRIVARRCRTRDDARGAWLLACETGRRCNKLSLAAQCGGGELLARDCWRCRLNLLPQRWRDSKAVQHPAHKSDQNLQSADKDAEAGNAEHKGAPSRSSES